MINVEEALNQLADNGHEVDFFAVQGEDERIITESTEYSEARTRFCNR